MTSTLELILIATLAALMRAWILGVIALLFFAIAGLVPMSAALTVISSIQYIVIVLLFGMMAEGAGWIANGAANLARSVLLKARGFANVAVATYKEVRS